jgi:ElaB/YqjD/DUF883 family membrane-anchored ribosome-binding protein
MLLAHNRPSTMEGLPMEVTTTNPNASTGNGIGGDVQRAISGAEALLREAAASGGEKAAELRDRALAQLRSVRETLEDTGTAVVEKSVEAARATDDYVHQHPWQAIAAAAGLGLLIGVLIARR